MADNAAASQSPQKPLPPPTQAQTQAQSTPDQMPTPISNPNISMGSPSISDLSQQGGPVVDSSVTLDYAHKQHQQQVQQQQQQQASLMASSSGFPMSQQQMQRSNSVQRLTQMQQQLQQNPQFGGATGMSPAALRMYGGSGQMSFGGGAQQQQQMLSRAGMMGQVAQLPMLQGQNPAHFGLQSQIIAQQRQKGMIQGTQFNPANVGQPLAGMQTMGMMSQMNTLGINQIRANGQLSYTQNQRFAQMRPQQQMSNQMVLTSPQKLAGQNLQRASSLGGMNQQITGLSQNGQPIQMALPQQQLQHQLQSQQLQPQQMQPPQQQMMTKQQQQALLLHQLSKQHQLQQQQHQSPRMVGSPLQRTASLTGSQQENNPVSSGHAATGLTNHGPESSNRIAPKRKITEIISQVDPLAMVDSHTEDFLLEVADGFLESVASFACNLAKHRKSSTLEPKDLLLPLEKSWGITIPGFPREEKKPKTSVPGENHKKRMEIVRALMDQNSGRSMPLMNKPITMVDDMASEQHGMLRTSSGAEAQFSVPSVGVMQKVTRF